MHHYNGLQSQRYSLPLLQNLVDQTFFLSNLESLLVLCARNRISSVKTVKPVGNAKEKKKKEYVV